MKTQITKSGVRYARGSSALALAIAATLSQSSFAAEADNAAVLEEIVVTAERRTQSLQEVSISATVLSAESLVKMGVNNVSQLQQVAPSVAINTYNRSTFINIRGVGIAQSAPTSSPGVAFYIDGSFIPHEFTIGQSFYDLAAVEVLRGPQGTLTGQNSTGGAVYVRTPDPEFNKWSGFADITGGNYHQEKYIAAINVPMGDMFALRVAATHDERDSFYTNIGSSPATPGDVNFDGYRGSLLFQPMEAFKVMLRYEHYKNDTHHNAIKNRYDVVTKDPYTIEEDAHSFFQQNGYRSSAEITYDFSSVRLRWLTSYQDGYTEDLSDGDRTNTAPPLVANQGRLGYGKTDIKTLINEVNVISTGDSSLSWVVGAFSLDEEVDVILRRYTNSTTVIPPGAAASTTLALAENKSESVFGQVGFKFVPELELIAGARYSQDEQVYDRTRATPGVNVGIQESNQVTGRVALNWTPADDLLLYTAIAKGYKAGGVNLGATDPNYEPEKNLVIEVGSKTTVLDGHLRINGDVFYSRYKDIQLISLRGTPALPYTQNSEGKSYGAELELQGVFGGFSTNFGISYLNAEFAEDDDLNLSERVNPTIVPSNAILNRSTRVVTGQTLPFSPKVTANLGMQYDFRFGDVTVTPRLQYSYVAKQLSTPFKPSDYLYDDITTVPSRNILDARLSVEPTDELRLEVFATNVLDKTYVASQVQDSSTALGGIIYGAPRQYGLRATYKFN